MAGTVHQIAVAVKTVDKATKPLRDIGRRMSKMRGPVGKLGRAFERLSTSTSFRALIARMKRLAKVARNVARKIRSGMKWAAAGFGLLAAGATAALMRITASADRIGKVADRVGITTAELQKLRFAAEQSGLETAELDKSMEKFNRSIGQARQKTGAQRDAFNQLGISLHDSTGKAKTTTQLMAEVANAMAKIEDPAKRAQIANDLFGRSGVGLLNMLKGGQKGLQEYGEQLEKAGGIQEDEFIRSSEAFNDAINLTKKTLGGFISGVLVPLIPRLTALIDKFREWAAAGKAELVKKLQSAMMGLGRFVKGLALGFKDLVSVVGEWWKSIKALFPVERKWTDNWARVTAKFGIFEKAGRKVIPIIAGIVAAMVAAKVLAFASSLTMLLNPITWIVVAAGALVVAIYKVYQNWDKVLAYLKDQWNQFKDNLIRLWEDIKAALLAVWQGIKSGLSAAWEFMKKILSFHPLALIISNWEPILGFFSGLWDKVKQIFTAAWERIIGPIKAGADWLKGLFGLGGETADATVTKKIINESTQNHTGIPGLSTDQSGPGGSPGKSSGKGSANPRASYDLAGAIQAMNQRGDSVGNKQNMKGEVVLAFKNPPPGLRVQGMTGQNMDLAVDSGPTAGTY